MYDLFYIGEANANWYGFKKAYPHARHVDLKLNYLDLCRDQSYTEMFWTARLDDKSLVDFSFDYMPPKYDRLFVHTWKLQINGADVLHNAIQLHPVVRSTDQVKYMEPVVLAHETLAVICHDDGNNNGNFGKILADPNISVVAISVVENVFCHAAKQCSSNMFWFIPSNVKIYDDWDFDLVVPEHDRKYIHVWPVIDGHGKQLPLDETCISLWPRSLALATEGNAFVTEDLKGYLKLYQKPCGLLHEIFDIFFVSYNEPNADENYDKLVSKFPRTKRIHGIKGIDRAHMECARQSSTSMFWTVDADTVIDDQWHFDFYPSVYDRDCVHLWYSRNPITGRSYGYGSVKLWPKMTVLEQKSNWLDFTTSFDKLKVFDSVIATTKFNTTPFETWKSSFRETIKLLKKLKECPNDFESKDRLMSWIKPHHLDQAYSEWCQRGAKDAILWYADQFADYHLINDFEYIQRYFKKLYNDV